MIMTIRPNYPNILHVHNNEIMLFVLHLLKYNFTYMNKLYHLALHVNILFKYL